MMYLSDGKNNGGSKRYNRKREPPAAKSDGFAGPRRSNSQKNKNFDKRPLERGAGRQYGATSGGRRDEVMYISKTVHKKYFEF